MKLLCVLLITALVATSFATEDDIQGTLTQIEKTKFGRTLLDTIQLQLQSGDPVEDLIHMLQDIEEDLENEQDEDDEFIERLQNTCDDELEKLEGEIKAARARSAELQAELNVKIPIRDEKVKLVTDKREFAHLVSEKITELDGNKILKDEEWAQEQQEHDRAQFVIEQAKEVITAGFAGRAAFLQKNAVQPGSPQSFVQLSQHFAESAKKGNFKRQGWTQVFKLLAQITASAPIQADAGNVRQITELCDQLLDKIAESREIERRDYQHWVDEYKQNRQGQVDKLEELNQQIANLDNEIATLNKRISNAQNEKAEQDQRAKDKQAQYNDKLKYCDDENIEYAERREQRRNDREVVGDAIGLLQSHLRTFRNYVNKRMSNDVQKAH